MYILSLKRLGNFLGFTEEIDFKHLLFINITNFRFFLFFSDHTGIKVEIENLLKIMTYTY